METGSILLLAVFSAFSKSPLCSNRFKSANKFDRVTLTSAILEQNWTWLAELSVKLDNTNTVYV